MDCDVYIVTQGNSDLGVIQTIGHVVYYCIEWSELYRASRPTKMVIRVLYTFSRSLSLVIVPYIKLSARLQGMFGL